MSNPKYPCRNCATLCMRGYPEKRTTCGYRTAKPLRSEKPTPSRAAIMRLAKAVRHEARDNGHWFEVETIEALNAVERKLKGKRK